MAATLERVLAALERIRELALSALLEIDHQGEIVAQEFCAGVIRSAERMTYTNVHSLLEGDAGLRERYRPLAARFERGKPTR